ncbi:MAG: sulfotransferase, partial [bacterium]
MSSAEELMAAARGATGLADFGEDSFREGLEKLMASLQAEAGLSEAGHASSRSRVIGLLSNRLQIE